MNSPFANLYLAIQERIKTQVPEIVFTEHDLGQLDDYTTGKPPVAFPCLLIDFENFTFENMGENSQRAEGDVVIKIGHSLWGKTDNATPDIWREAALNYYDIEWKVNKALHGFTPGDDYGYLTRTSENKQNRPAYVRQKTMRYRLAFEDYSTQTTQLAMVKPPAEIE